jgi:hypothetical protein
MEMINRISSHVSIPMLEDIKRTASLQNVFGEARTRAFLQSPDGSLAMTGDIDALEGLPMAADGTPDFDKIEQLGGRVAGAIPPNADSKFSIGMDSTVTTYYAANVTFQGRTVYLSGANVSGSEHSTPAQKKQAAEAALKYFAKLPHTAIDALKRRNEQNFFDIN